jgi:hypothetical protein
LVASGLSLLGVMCLVLFVTCLARDLANKLPTGSVLPWVTIVGGAMTGGGTVVGYAAFALMAQAADLRVTPATYAALQSAVNGTAYIAYTPMLIVTGAVAVAGLRLHVVPLWLAILSALTTLVMAAATFLPFVNWFPALVWTPSSSASRCSWPHAHCRTRNVFENLLSPPERISATVLRASRRPAPRGR